MKLKVTVNQTEYEIDVEVEEEENCTTCVLPEADKPKPETVPAEVTEKIRPVALPARAKEEK